MIARVARRLFGLLFAAALFGVAVLSGWLALTTHAAYDEFSTSLTQSDLTNGRMPLSSKIFDRNGKLLNEVFSDTRRTYVAVGQVSPFLRHATIATEDADFYDNYGVSPRGVARAVWANIESRDFVQGGSTITQQLIKLTVIPDEERTRTPERKLKEALLAIILTQRYSKDQILEWYLNQVFYGNNSYGIETAAQSYFGKPSSDLTLAEAALLAGIPQAPAAYDPYSRFNAAKARQEDVLDLMVRHGFITAAQAGAAKQEKLDLRPLRFSMEAPHFVMYIRELLEARYGPDVLYRGGLQVTTTLDLDLQKQAEAIVKEAVSSAPYQRRKAGNAALLAIRPETGEVLTMVGSADFGSDAIAGQINMAVAERQPGSTIKPFTYATAFQKGWTPATVLKDEPTGFPDGRGGRWTPASADGQYRGQVTVRQALAMSLNTPAVLALQHIGLPALLETVHRMGITSLTRNDYGLSLTLGGGEVRLIDLVYAYTAFANNGALNGQQRPRSQVRPGMRELDPVLVLKVETASGAVLEEFTGPQQRQVLPAPYAWLINNILSDNVARTPVFGPNNPLVLLGRPAAAKTGTTDNNRDNWTMGYTPDLVTGVWVGNTDYSTMTPDAFGSTNAAPIWNAFMAAALKGTPASAFVQPPGITKAKVCASTGRLVGNSGCPDTREEFFVAAAMPAVEELTGQQKAATATAQAGATATAAATLTPQPTATPSAAPPTATRTPAAGSTATPNATATTPPATPRTSPTVAATPPPATAMPSPTATPAVSPTRLPAVSPTAAITPAAQATPGR